MSPLDDARRKLQHRQDELVNALIAGEPALLDPEHFARTHDVVMRKRIWVQARRRVPTFFARLRQALRLG